MSSPAIGLAGGDHQLSAVPSFAAMNDPGPVRPEYPSRDAARSQGPGGIYRTGQARAPAAGPVPADDRDQRVHPRGCATSPGSGGSRHQGTRRSRSASSTFPGLQRQEPSAIRTDSSGRMAALRRGRGSICRQDAASRVGCRNPSGCTPRIRGASASRRAAYLPVCGHSPVRYRQG